MSLRSNQARIEKSELEQTSGSCGALLLALVVVAVAAAAVVESTGVDDGATRSIE